MTKYTVADLVGLVSFPLWINDERYEQAGELSKDTLEEKIAYITVDGAGELTFNTGEQEGKFLYPAYSPRIKKWGK